MLIKAVTVLTIGRTLSANFVFLLGNSVTYLELKPYKPYYFDCRHTDDCSSMRIAHPLQSSEDRRGGAAAQEVEV